jgi:alanyl-tRNA synthetase
MTSEGFQNSTEKEAASLVGIVLDSTPFYAEQGGQVADTGRITSTSDLGYMEVQDTQVPLPPS